MTELEQALRELELDWPATPDLATAVGARLAAPSRPRLRPRRRWAAALAALVLLVGGTLAIPPARAKVFHWLGITSVEIKVAPIPTVGASLDLGTARPLAAARHVPKALGTPSAVYRTPLPTGTTAESLVYPGPLLVQTFRASVEPFIEKTLAIAGDAQKLNVDGNPAYWIDGAHGFAYTTPGGQTDFESQRIADRTLLVERKDGLLIRVEGKLSRDRAVAIARSIQ